MPEPNLNNLNLICLFLLKSRKVFKKSSKITHNPFWHYTPLKFFCEKKMPFFRICTDTYLVLGEEFKNFQQIGDSYSINIVPKFVIRVFRGFIKSTIFCVVTKLILSFIDDPIFVGALAQHDRIDDFSSVGFFSDLCCCIHSCRNPAVGGTAKP